MTPAYAIEPLERRLLLTILISATTGNDTLLIDRDGSSGDIIVTLNGVTTMRTVPVGETDVLVRGHAGDDIIDIVDVTGLNLRVLGDAGNDTITMGAGDGSSFGFRSTTELVGGTGTDTLIFDDTNVPAPSPGPFPSTGTVLAHGYEFAADGTFRASVTVKAFLPPDTIITTIHDFDFEIVTLNAGPSSTVIKVEGDGGADILNINGGAGFDSLNFNNLSITATVNFNGGADNDFVTVNDSNAAGAPGDFYNVGTSNITRTGFAGALNFSSVVSIGLTTHNAGVDVFVPDIAAGVAVTVTGGSGDDVFLVGDSDFDTNINGDIRVNGGGGRDFLGIDDSADSASSDGYSLTSPGFNNYTKTSSASVLSFLNVEEVSLSGNGGSNAFSVVEPLDDMEVLNISGLGGADTFTVMPSATMQIHITGGDPTTAPGDRLVFQNASAAGGAVLSGGTYDFASAQDVVTTGVETLPQPPAPPTVPDLIASDDTGISFVDNITSRSSLTFIGTTSANQQVLLFAGTTLLGETIASASGTWSITTGTLADGTYAVSAATRVPGSGLTGPRSAALNVTIDTVAPVTPAIAPDLATNSDTGLSFTDNITSDNTPQFIGFVPANDIVRLFVDGVLVASDTTTPTGAYSIITPVLADGVRQVAVKFEDLAGNESGVSPALAVTIDTVAPAAPTVAPDMTEHSDTGVSNSDNITRQTRPVFVGARPTDVAVHLVQGNVNFGQVLTIGSTSYSITTRTLTDGDYDFAAIFEDVAGNLSPAGPVVEVTIDTLAPKLVGTPAFQFDTAPHRLTYNFSENVGPTFGNTDVSVISTPGNAPVTSAVAYDAGINLGTVTFPGVANGVLDDGRYRARIVPTGITDIAGNPLASEHTLDFLFLRGDANNDGIVNLTDFNILASNFGQSNRTFSQGNFNYDTVVNLADFNILAARFGSSVAPAGTMGGSTGGDRERILDGLL